MSSIVGAIRAKIASRNSTGSFYRLIRKTFGLGLALSILSGCVSLNSMSLTQIPVKRTNKIEASASKTIFFFFSFDNEFIDSVVAKLKRQCRGGQVKGVLTKDEVTNYFLMFVHKREVTATGYCSKGGRA